MASTIAKCSIEAGKYRDEQYFFEYHFMQQKHPKSKQVTVCSNYILCYGIKHKEIRFTEVAK